MTANTTTSDGCSSPSHSCQPTANSATIGTTVISPVSTRSRVSLEAGWISSGPGGPPSRPLAGFSLLIVLADNLPAEPTDCLNTMLPYAASVCGHHAPG